MTVRFAGLGVGVALAMVTVLDCGGTGKTTGGQGTAGVGASGSAGVGASGTGGVFGFGGFSGSTSSGAGGSSTSGAAGSAMTGMGGMGMTGAAGGNPSGSGGSIQTGQAGNPGVVSCTPGQAAVLITDCGYPTTTGSSLSKVTFSENEVLAAIQPSGGAPEGIVRLFYSDEHAMTLGIHSVVVKDASGTMTMDYPVSPLMSDPGSVMSAQLGTTALTGDQSGLDPSLRPIWPVLYITDITSDPNNRAGDWQQGGAPTGPTDVFGSWKGAVRTVDKTVTPNTVVITPDKDPAKNNLNLGPGADPLPAGLTKTEGYTSEVRWTVPLANGHNYRVQVIVHDGDQNKGGGDCGEACVLFCAGGTTGAGGNGGGMGGNSGAAGEGYVPPPPKAMCPPNVAACGPGGIEPTSCPAGTVCANGCCLSDIIVM